MSPLGRLSLSLLLSVQQIAVTNAQCCTMPDEKGDFINDPNTKTIGWKPNPTTCLGAMGLDTKDWPGNSAPYPAPHVRQAFPNVKEVRGTARLYPSQQRRCVDANCTVTELVPYNQTPEVVWDYNTAEKPLKEMLPPGQPNVMDYLPKACVCPSNENGREKCQKYGCKWVTSPCPVHARCAFCNEVYPKPVQKPPKWALGEDGAAPILAASPSPSPSGSPAPQAVLVKKPPPPFDPFAKYSVKENFHDQWKMLNASDGKPTPPPWNRDGGEGWEAKYIRSKNMQPPEPAEVFGPDDKDMFPNDR